MGFYIFRIVALAAMLSGMSYDWARAAQDFLVNLPPAAKPGAVAPQFQPGVAVVLPDGRQAVIEEYLPNGDIRTDIGIVLSPLGIVKEGPDQGKPATLAEENKSPDKPEAAAGQNKPESVMPEKKSEEAGALPKTAQPAAPSAVAPAKSEDRALTLAELLPMTTVPPEKEAKKPETKKAEPKAEKKREKTKNPSAPQKSKAGQELRIPPEAAANGNLDFLEGCWQGTRPEYYSKRTIRECFCFGANGGSGKRYVFDPKGRRMCVGASRANLSSNGVLSVTSSGAACDDGERWGSAEMMCRNSGPKTPCSWIFRDARNGRQSYEIPFVRVESCGR